MAVIRTTLAGAIHALAIPAALVLAATALGPVAARAQGPPDVGTWVAPERAAKRTNPNPTSASTIKRGKDLYTRECAKCHGKAGKGDGPQATFLEVRPRDLASPAVAGQSDGALFWKLTEGFGPMPKVNMNDNDKWAMVDYVRTLGKNP